MIICFRNNIISNLEIKSTFQIWTEVQNSKADYMNTDFSVTYKNIIYKYIMYSYFKANYGIFIAYRLIINININTISFNKNGYIVHV